MIFYVIDKDGNVDGSRDWVVTQGGELRSLTEGWGCEGGGGSDPAPYGHRAVFGTPPEEVKLETVHAPFEKVKCSCGRSFTTQQGLGMHRSSKGCM